MTAGRFLGFDRDAAARISFLMAIPVTAGAVVFKMAELVKDGIPEDLRVPMVVGDRHLRHHRLDRGVGHAEVSCARTASCRSSIYRVLLGIVVLVIVAGGWR